MTESVDPAEIRRAAMYWLARRDHSRQEIHRKLQKKFGAELDTGPYLDWLEEHNFLNDARYIEVFLRSAIERGHGLLRIRQDLQQRGLDRQRVEEALQALEVDWFALAAQLRQRRFGALPQRADQKEKARQLRFLQYRGFSADQCFHALETDLSAESSPAGSGIR